MYIHACKRTNYPLQLLLLQHLFSAILNRDQAYQSVLDQGMILGLPWGTDLEGTREAVGGGGKGGGATATSASKQLEEKELEGTD